MKKVCLSALVICASLMSCHKDRFKEYVAEMSIQQVGNDSAAVQVSGYLTNSIDNPRLGFTYTTSDQVYSWTGQNLFIDPLDVADGSYSAEIGDLDDGVVYTFKPFALVDNNYYYTEKEFQFEIPKAPNNIGDTGPAGGIVFYSDGEGGGMEVMNLNWYAAWGGYGVTVPSTYSDYGYGQTNTNIILNYVSDADAAEMCDTYSYNGYDDWFLPSSEEAELIYSGLVTQGIGNIPSGLAWTSTANFGSSNQYSKVVNMSNGTVTGSSRLTSLLVLPVRVIE
ncbi:MAG: hypothetical protein ABJG68_06515 [Crocinitomicaceae bacterium]